MAHTNVYFDETIARQVATGLVGSEVRLTQRSNITTGFSFRVMLQADRGVERSTMTRISDLPPEVVADTIYEAAPKVDDAPASRSRFVAGVPDAYTPGTPVVIRGVQLAADGKDASARLGSEECARYIVRGAHLTLHMFCVRDAERHIDSLVGHPLEVAGILRYTTPYAVPGAHALSLGLRLCAVWLA